MASVRLLVMTDCFAERIAAFLFDLACLTALTMKATYSTSGSGGVIPVGTVKKRMALKVVVLAVILIATNL